MKIDRVGTGVASALVVALCGACDGSAAGPRDVCSSSGFREAFLAGQADSIDVRGPSAALVEFGEDAVPCLIRIVEEGGKARGISGCSPDTADCRTWAMGALRQIGTPEARSFLVEQVERAGSQEVLRAAIQTVGAMRARESRGTLLSLLASGSPEVRMESLLALGAIGERSDFEAMAASVDSFADSDLGRVVHAFRVLADRRAFDVLERRLARVKESKDREAASRAISAWRADLVVNDETVNALRAAHGERLYNAIGGVHAPSPEVRAALVELLRCDDARARAESVLVLGKMHVSSDFDQLLEATLSLPEPYIATGARGLMFFGDPRAIGPLENYAANMRNAERERDVRQIIDRLRRSSATPR